MVRPDVFERQAHRVTTSSRTAYRSRRLFYKSHRSLIPLLLPSKPDPLRWAPVWLAAPHTVFLFGFRRPCAIPGLRPGNYEPLGARPRRAGGQDLRWSIQNLKYLDCSDLSRRRGLYVVRDDSFYEKTIARSFRRPSSPNQTCSPELRFGLPLCG